MRTGTDPKPVTAASRRRDRLIHIWVSLPRNRSVPKTLRHSFTFVAEDGAPLGAGDASVDVRSVVPLVVSLPFRSGDWYAHNGPGNHRAAHWGSALVAEGSAKFPNGSRSISSALIQMGEQCEVMFKSRPTPTGSDSDTKSLRLPME